MLSVKCGVPPYSSYICLCLGKHVPESSCLKLRDPHQICSNGTQSFRFLCCSFHKGCLSSRTAWHHPLVSSLHPLREWGDSGEQFLTGVASVRHGMGALSELPFAGPGPLPRPELHSFLRSGLGGVGEIGLHYKGKISPNCLLRKGPRAVFH